MKIKTKEVLFSDFVNGRYYKLFLDENNIGVLQINGILMHRIKDTNPLLDAQMKVKSLGDLKNKKVLDIGTCLGYTALFTLDMGAQLVITIENSKIMLELIKLNPLSRRILKGKRIKLILADAFVFVKTLPSFYFDAIVNDPPHIKLAGKLYSNEFYEELLRILKPNGVLFSYTGAVGSKYRNIDIQRAIYKRLLKVGFRHVEVRRDLLGVVAKK